MPRLPALDREHLPACFAISFAPKKALCRRCPVSARCRPLAREWSHQRSLTELCCSAEEATQAPSHDVASIERIYDHEYLTHFGRRSRRKSTPKNDLIFSRLVYLCASEDIDPATYIGANMRAMRAFVEASPYGFQPNMLSGDRARGRYNAFVRHANRRYHRALSDVAHVDTALGKLRRDLVFGETEVGELFVRSAWAGRPIEWWQAIERADPSSVWLDFESQRGGVWTDWVGRVGAPRAQQEKQLARLRAAVAVANTFESDFADHVGVTDFSWTALAEMVARTFPAPRREKLNLGGVPGAMWR